MARKITIPLSEPRVDITGQTISEVVLRPPTSGELFAIGEPWVRHDRPDGGFVIIENIDVIRAYIEALVEKPESTAVINALAFEDGLALKAEILNFFVVARRKTSKESATRSSSEQGSSTPTPSEK